jgi:colanic acid biosynthesis glycosyl transferase WcaI
MGQAGIMIRPPMKVLLLNQTFYPDPVATAQQLTDLAEYLVQNGCEVTVVTGRRGYDRRQEIHKAHENYKGIEVFRVGSTGFGKKSFFHRFIDAVSFELALIGRLLRLRRHDVVVSFTSPPLIGVVGALLAVYWRCRSVQWLMDINPDIAIAVGYLKRNGLIARFLTATLRFSLKRSEDIVVLDRWMRERVLAHGSVNNRVHIVPPWPVHDFDAEGFRGAPKNNAFRTELGLDGKFVILYSGNHSIVHPLDTLLEAARLLRDDDKIAFVFIGGGMRVGDVTRFKEFHELPNILQVGHQPRERLHETLTFADMHSVVMGHEVNGLVHVSKIYGVLATGRPYIFIGPKQSHVGDLLAECPYGFQAEHGKPEEVIEAIRKTQALSEAKLLEYERRNLEYVGRNYRSGGSKARFLDEVIHLGGERAPEKARAAGL